MLQIIEHNFYYSGKDMPSNVSLNPFNRCFLSRNYSYNEFIVLVVD